jgi:hypothetical protein
MSSPTRLLGSATLRTPRYCADTWSGGTPVPAVASCTPAVNEPKRAVAASTAVAIAMPFVMAFVVLPTASSEVSTAAPSPCTSPDISAMPCALSDTGPKVSMATMTPTVVSRPQPASATAKRESTMTPPPSRNAAYTAAPMSSAE